jgi:hypothetical protein
VIRKFQVFVSSTFNDMRTERQAAVEAILEAGHIPAGMELFTAGDESQLDTIKRWIEGSDVYLLVLGGRYGSLEPKSGKSYIHVEYEYALELEKPVFAVVVAEPALDEKVKTFGRGAIEESNGPLLQQFRKLVLSKTSRFFDDPKDIKIAVHQKLAELSARTDIVGWVRGDETNNAQLATELAALSQENRTLRARVEALPAASAPQDGSKQFQLPSDLSDDDLVALLRSAFRKMPDAQKYSVMFFEHVDEGLGLPAGTTKRLVKRVIKDLYDVESMSEKTITLSRRRPQVTGGRSSRGI